MFKYYGVISPKGCHAIHSKDSSILEQYLSEITDQPMKICKRLEIADCNQLANEDRLTPFYLSERYLDQTLKPCWEDIVRLLCVEFKKRSLAKRVADKHGVEYEQYCSEKEL